MQGINRWPTDRKVFAITRGDWEQNQGDVRFDLVLFRTDLVLIHNPNTNIHPKCSDAYPDMVPWCTQACAAGFQDCQSKCEAEIKSVIRQCFDFREVRFMVADTGDKLLDSNLEVKGAQEKIANSLEKELVTKINDAIKNTAIENDVLAGELIQHLKDNQKFKDMLAQLIRDEIARLPARE